MLFALLAGTGLRIGEALGLKLGAHLSGDFSTIRVRQSVWRGSVQTPKTDNAVREIDVSSSLAAFLKVSVGGRTSGFLFQTESGRRLTQRNISRNGLEKIRRDMKLEAGKSFHSFRRFRTAHLRKNRVPLVNPVVSLDFYQISNRGRKLPPGAEEFKSFLQNYIARWAGRAGIL